MESAEEHEEMHEEVHVKHRPYAHLGERLPRVPGKPKALGGTFDTASRSVLRKLAAGLQGMRLPKYHPEQIAFLEPRLEKMDPAKQKRMADGLVAFFPWRDVGGDQLDQSSKLVMYDTGCYAQARNVISVMLACNSPLVVTGAEMKEKRRSP